MFDVCMCALLRFTYERAYMFMKKEFLRVLCGNFFVFLLMHSCYFKYDKNSKKIISDAKTMNEKNDKTSITYCKLKLKS